MEYLKGLKKFHIEEPTVVTIGKFGTEAIRSCSGR